MEIKDLYPFVINVPSLIDYHLTHGASPGVCRKTPRTLKTGD